jgi:hypothetical protein
MLPAWVGGGPATSLAETCAPEKQGISLAGTQRDPRGVWLRFWPLRRADTSKTRVVHSIFGGTKGCLGASHSPEEQAEVDVSSALSASTRSNAGVSDLSALRSSPCARMSMCPTRITPRRELNSVCPTGARNVSDLPHVSGAQSPALRADAQRPGRAGCRRWTPPPEETGNARRPPRRARAASGCFAASD